jgi:hypothetical protein
MRCRCATFYFKKKWWIFIVLLLGFPWPIEAGTKMEFRFANLPNTYMNEHVKESRMAMQIILKKVFNLKYPELHLKLDFLPDNDQLVQTLRKTGYDVLTMTGFDYLQLKKEIELKPLLILCRSDQPTESLLLMARIGITLASIAHNPRRTLLIEKSAGETISRTWLDEELGDQGYPSCNAMFTTIRSVDRPSRAILPVFFGQADMCIVTRAALDLMTELNPQISEKLAIVKQSPGLINMLVCGTDQLEEWAEAIILKEATDMHFSPSGRQAITMIQMNHFLPFEPDYLKATERLYQKSRRTAAGER